MLPSANKLYEILISFSEDCEHGRIHLHVYVGEDLCTAEFSDMDTVAD